MQTILATFISTFKVIASQNSFLVKNLSTGRFTYVIKIAAKFNLKEPNFKKFPGVPGGMPPDPLAFSMLHTMPMAKLVHIHYCYVSQASKVL